MPGHLSRKKLLRIRNWPVEADNQWSEALRNATRSIPKPELRGIYYGYATFAAWFA